MLRVGLLKRILNRFDFELFSNATLTDSCHVFGDSISGFYDKLVKKKTVDFKSDTQSPTRSGLVILNFPPKPNTVIVYEYKLPLTGGQTHYVMCSAVTRIESNGIY